MKASEFCFWLQGYFEISESDELTPKQVQCIKKHLHLAFVHDIDHTHGDAEQQEALNEIHNGPAVTDGPYSSLYTPPKIRC